MLADGRFVVCILFWFHGPQTLISTVYEKAFKETGLINPLDTP